MIVRVLAGFRAVSWVRRFQRVTVRATATMSRKTKKPLPGKGFRRVVSVPVRSWQLTQVMEAAGIAPASREASVRASTCVADRLLVGLGAPVGRVSFGLSCHEFNPSRNKRLGSGDPELSSPAGSLGRRPGARPLLGFRQRDGAAHQRCWRLSFGRLFTRPADQPRHAAVHLGHPVDPGSPPNGQGCRRCILILRQHPPFFTPRSRIPPDLPPQYSMGTLLFSAIVLALWVSLHLPGSARSREPSQTTDGASGTVRRTKGRVAPGEQSPGAPTDPYVPSQAYGSSHHELATGRHTERISSPSRTQHRDPLLFCWHG